ncbi:MAG: primase alpha helix C-terminal domain-containing protein [Bacteroidota bacterium]
MNQHLLNEYDNIRTSKISKTTTIEQWFDLIKKSEYSASITAARPFGKKHPMYVNVKYSVPAITYNFTFQSMKSNATISGATGLMYIDVDDLSYDINSLDTSKVFAYYKSFGGAGYSIIVQVDNLSLENYSSTYGFILDDLGLSDFFDLGAKKATQFNVLSYDPDLFINYDSFVFTATDTISEIENESPSIIIKEKKIYKAEGDSSIANSYQPIRYNNLNEIEIIGNYAFNWSGWVYVDAWLPYNRKIEMGKRNNTLLSYTNNLVWLNPQLSEQSMYNILCAVNNKKCEEPLDKAQVKSIVRSIFRYKESGTLNPKFNTRKRKILFANQTGLSREQKLEICRTLLAEKKQNDSLQKIDVAIREWDFEANGKITIRAVVKVAKMSYKTVVKYWSEFKEDVKQLNDNSKNKPLEAPVEAPVLGMAVGHPQPDFVNRKLIITNPERYKRGTQLLSFMDKYEMEARLSYLVKSGFTGEVEIVADDTAFVFDLQQEVEFVGFGVLADAA